MVSSNASVNSTLTVSTTGSTSSSGSGGGTAPKPIPMALMRNSHEVIRGAMKEINDFLEQDDFESARQLWHQFHRFSDLHMKMEEGRKSSNAGGLFKLVDEHADGAAKKAGLRHHHRNLYELEEDVVDIFEKAPDMERAKEIYPIFWKENEEHLKEEEDVLMPAIQKMVKKGVPVKKYIISDILPLLLVTEGDMEFFLRFANEVLARHDNVPGKPRVRVFDQAVWSVAKPEQWMEWKEYIKDSLPEEKYQEVNTAIRAYVDEQKAKQQAKEAAAKQKEIPPVMDVQVKEKKTGLFNKIFAKS